MRLCTTNLQPPGYDEFISQMIGSVQVPQWNWIMFLWKKI